MFGGVVPRFNNGRPVLPPSVFDRIRASQSVTTRDGQPNVDGLLCDVIEQGGRPYMERFFLLGPNAAAPGSKARYHHILQSDLQDVHDHPWDFVSVILAGSYIETTPTSEAEFGPGSVLVRKAEDFHRLTLRDGPVWSFIVVGPARRRWGFQTGDGWLPWQQYLGVPAQQSTHSRTW